MGSVREAEAGISVAELAKQISMGLYKAACCAKVDGKLCDLRTQLNGDCALEILTFEQEDGKKTFWHTASHMLAQAVKRLYPNVKLAIGPAIDNGFYYDFDCEKPFTAEDLAALEKEIKKIAKENLPLTRVQMSPEEATALMEEKDETYKVELIAEHAGKGEDISLYQQGDFIDLCAGPHLMSTGVVKAVKLTQCTGAYWRGDATSKQLCRVYGVAFPKASELEAHLAAVEEAKKRDHNLIGRQLKYFCTSDVVGQGLPLLMPKGAKLFQILNRYVQDKEEQEYGYVMTKTPLMAKSDLYKISGHWDHYKDGICPASNDLPVPVSGVFERNALLP